MNQFRERKQVEWWNERYPDGTPVGYFFTSKDRAFKQAKTRGAAFISDAGKAVLFLEGRSSYVALANVRPITCAHHLRVALCPIADCTFSPKDMTRLRAWSNE